ncbi:hypothetical protein M8J77_024844 [Diaphorina citri]|nr:hypothetical protein M8J77_024844 [Diaphorina citri]
MAVSVVELDDKLVKALKIMNSNHPNAAEQLKLLLDEAIKEKYGSSRKPVSVLSKINSSSSSVKKLSGGGISDELPVKKPKSLPESKISKLISKHTSSPSGSPSPPTVSILEDDVEMKSDESSRASSDSRGSPGLEIVDDYNKCFVCKNKRAGGSSTSGNKLIECAECHSSYHQECHTPPISDSDAADPRLIWYCVQCMRTMNKKTAAPMSSKSNTKSSSSSSKSGSSSYFSTSSSSGGSSKYSSSSSSKPSSSSSSSSSKPTSSGGATTSSSLISADKRIQIMKKRAASKKPEPPKKGKK